MTESYHACWSNYSPEDSECSVCKIKTECREAFLSRVHRACDQKLSSPEEVVTFWKEELDRIRTSQNRLLQTVPQILAYKKDLPYTIRVEAPWTANFVGDLKLAADLSVSLLKDDLQDEYEMMNVAIASEDVAATFRDLTLKVSNLQEQIETGSYDELDGYGCSQLFSKELDEILTLIPDISLDFISERE